MEPMEEEIRYSPKFLAGQRSGVERKAKVKSSTTMEDAGVKSSSNDTNLKPKQ
jgi:hypothetical protein